MIDRIAGGFPHKLLARLLRAVTAFAFGAAGALCILGLRFVLHGSADPFDGGWPLYLQAASFATALAITLQVGHGGATALGVYGGLLAWMLAAGAAEYPVASAIALAVHGLIPAVVGAALASLWGLWRSGPRRATA